MKAAAKPVLDDIQSIHMLPCWITSVRRQDTDTVAFTSWSCTRDARCGVAPIPQAQYRVALFAKTGWRLHAGPFALSETSEHPGIEAPAPKIP